MASGSSWGGGIEMAAAAHLKQVHVLVYEPASAGSANFRRIGSFGAMHRKAVRVLYQGGVHFDALELDPQHLRGSDGIPMRSSHALVPGLAPGAFGSVSAAGFSPRREQQSLFQQASVKVMGRRGGAEETPLLRPSWRS
mmetsp:Transcript_44040/g.99570  ORF Transcript_44040/g.99570 Transcript_44040/m.99570 type:complete len:139 (-) Transcript_44040:269-685(-)